MMVANNNYWLEREQNKAYRSAKRLNKSLEKVYKRAYREINRELEDLWLKMLSDGEVSNATLYKDARLNKLLQALQMHLNALGVQTITDLQMTLTETLRSAWEVSSENLQADSLMESTTLINDQLAKEIVNANYKNATFSERVWDNLQTIRSQIEASIINTAITGQDVKKASRVLAERMGVSLSDAKRIVITENDRVLQESCRQNALRRGYKTYSILIESDACPVCKDKFTGKHFPLAEQVLPEHPFCKCCMRIDLD